MGIIRVRFPVGARDTPDNLTSCCFHAIIVNIRSIGVLGLRISVFHTEGEGSIPLWTAFNNFIFPAH